VYKAYEQYGTKITSIHPFSTTLYQAAITVEAQIKNLFIRLKALFSFSEESGALWHGSY